MKSFRIISVFFFLIAGLSSSYGQGDEKYYYKLGKKYMITKDYETATKHFNKCASIAEKSKNENPNYYYYPLLMYYYGFGKEKQVSKIAELITEQVPESPNVPTMSNSGKEKDFNKFFDAYGIEINKSDYIFLRHFLHFRIGEMDVVETFDRMEFAVRYHNNKSVIPLEDSFNLIRDIYMKEYEKDANPEASAAPFKVRLCGIFTNAAKAGNGQAKTLVEENCE